MHDHLALICDDIRRSLRRSNSVQQRSACCIAAAAKQRSAFASQLQHAHASATEEQHLGTRHAIAQPTATLHAGGNHARFQAPSLMAALYRERCHSRKDSGRPKPEMSVANSQSLRSLCAPMNLHCSARGLCWKGLQTVWTVAPARDGQSSAVLMAWPIAK